MILPPGLQAMRERADKATAGPWFADFDKRDDGADQVITQNVTIAFIATPLESYRNDAVFIAASRTDVPALLDLIETLAEALERYTERLPCEYNDRGYCQTHGCERPCKVEVKLAALDKYREFGK